MPLLWPRTVLNGAPALCNYTASIGTSTGIRIEDKLSEPIAGSNSPASAGTDLRNRASNSAVFFCAVTDILFAVRIRPTYGLWKPMVKRIFLVAPLCGHR